MISGDASSEAVTLASLLVEEVEDEEAEVSVLEDELEELSVFETVLEEALVEDVDEDDGVDVLPQAASVNARTAAVAPTPIARPSFFVFIFLSFLFEKRCFLLTTSELF